MVDDPGPHIRITPKGILLIGLVEHGIPLAQARDICDDVWPRIEDAQLKRSLEATRESMAGE